jgi:two-component system alkaline phosphatase synthesis response regulator PhoP
MRGFPLKQETILVAEAEHALRETIAFHLRREGYTVFEASDGVAALDMARRGVIGMVLLDLLLPQLDSLDVCRQLRLDPQTASLPIVLLLPRQMELIPDMSLGVTEVLLKPFGWKELRALVRSTLRRHQQEQHTRWLREANSPEEVRVFDVGDLHIDIDRREVTRGGQPVELKTRLFDLLVYLARYPDIVLTYDRLLSHVWGPPVGEKSKTLYVHVRWLREKLEDDPSHPHLIETVYGVGYRFNAASVNTHASRL